MSTVYQFEISHKSGLIDCLSVSADCIATAWRTAERLTGAGTVKTVRICNHESFGDKLWHPMTEARRLEHINRVSVATANNPPRSDRRFAAAAPCACRGISNSEVTP